MRYAALTHPTQESGFIKSTILSSLFKLRVGDYRVLYSFNDETEIITIHRLGHRREIYL